MDYVILQIVMYATANGISHAHRILNIEESGITFRLRVAF